MKTNFEPRIKTESQQVHICYQLTTHTVMFKQVLHSLLDHVSYAMTFKKALKCQNEVTYPHNKRYHMIVD